jgi:hypothetical protein
MNTYSYIYINIYTTIREDVILGGLLDNLIVWYVLSSPICSIQHFPCTSCDFPQLYLASDRQPVDLQWYELCTLDCDMDHFEELASWDVGSLNTYLWDLLYLASCIPAILQWRRSYKYFIVFCGLGYRRFWLAKGADMVDLVIDIACIYGNGSRLISWNLSNLSPFF